MAYYGEEMAYEGDLLEGVPELFEDPFAKQFGPEVPQPAIPPRTTIGLLPAL